MSVLGLIAFISGTLGVWLTIKQNIYCWPVSLIAVLTSIFDFFYERLYGDMALQVFYLFAGIYGWIYWEKHKNAIFKVEKIKWRVVPVLVLVTAAQSIIFYFLISYFKGDRPLLDSILTASSLTTTYMMTKKWVENWLVWVFIDSAYLVLYGIKYMWLFAALYLLFAVIAFYGWLKWKKTV